MLWPTRRLVVQRPQPLDERHRPRDHHHDPGEGDPAKSPLLVHIGSFWQLLEHDADITVVAASHRTIGYGGRSALRTAVRKTASAWSTTSVTVVRHGPIYGRSVMRANLASTSAIRSGWVKRNVR